MKEFLEYAKRKGVKSIDLDTLCLINDFFKETKSKQSSLNVVRQSVLCVDNDTDLIGLTIGKKYEIIAENKQFYKVNNDCGLDRYFVKERFKKA
tara:strand:+ start:150 stop:431 length:282 start_codon:yes stop_codon:yes gene_type:complete